EIGADAGLLQRLANRLLPPLAHGNGRLVAGDRVGPHFEQPVAVALDHAARLFEGNRDALADGARHRAVEMAVAGGALQIARQLPRIARQKLLQRPLGGPALAVGEADDPADAAAHAAVI